MEVVLLISNLLTPGDKVEVTKINKQGEKGKIKTYYSKIYDIIDDKDILKIAMPVLDTKIVLLGMNMNYELYIINDNGMYQCQGTLIERYREKNLFVAVIQLYTKLEKVQRRQFYRLETNIDVKYKLITKDEISEFHEATTAEKHNEILDAKEYINGITIDISGGGLRLTSDRAHVRGEYIVIDHHDGTMTLYAHMYPNSRRVSKGDTVVQGQVIGQVGTTGNSTRKSSSL